MRDVFQITMQFGNDTNWYKTDTLENGTLIPFDS